MVERSIIAAVIILLLHVGHCLAFAPSTLWSHHYGTPAQGMQATAIVDGADGQICVAGTRDAEASPGWKDGFLLLLDSAGIVSSSVSYGGARHDFLVDVTSSQDFAFIAVGQTNSEGPGTPTQFNSYVVKSNGSAPGWSVASSLTGSDNARSVVQEFMTGAVVVAGLWQSDTYLWKLNAEGTTIWVHTYGGSGPDNVRKVIECSEGGYLFVGSTSSILDYYSDVFVVRTDTAGVELWTAALGDSGQDEGFSVVETSDEGFLIGGADGSPDGTSSFAGLYKLNSSGNMEWNHIYETETELPALCVEQRFEAAIAVGYRFATNAPNGGLTIVETDLAGAVTECNSILSSDNVHFGSISVGIGPSLLAAGNVFMGDCNDGGYYRAALSKTVYDGSRLEFSADTLEFPITYVGTTSTLSIKVHNRGTGPSAVPPIDAGEPIFSVGPIGTSIPAGDSVEVTFAFTPTFTHDFVCNAYMTLDGDLDNSPKQVIVLMGKACHAVSSPAAPRLASAGSANHLYFGLSWDDNDQPSSYAIEVSSDDFASSLFVACPFGVSDTPVFRSGPTWGKYGTGVISGLAPSTTYSCRVIARDCLGMEFAGPVSSAATEREHVMGPANLTVQILSDSTGALHWNDELADTSGVELEGQGWIVLYGDNPDSLNSVLTGTRTGPVVFSTDTMPSPSFFEVLPSVNDIVIGSAPIISWPPDGSTVAGRNSLYVQDLLHAQSWDSFRVIAVASGDSVLIGSSAELVESIYGLKGAAVDYSALSPGDFTITLVVVDTSGHSHSTEISVHVVREPFVTFELESVTTGVQHSIVQLDTIGTGCDLPIAEVLWRSSAGEAYGGSPHFAVPSRHTQLIVRPKLMPELRVLCESPDWFRDGNETVGVSLCDPSRQSTFPLSNLQGVFTSCRLDTVGLVQGNYPYSEDQSTNLGGSFAFIYGGSVNSSFDIVEVYYTVEVVANILWTDPYQYLVPLEWGQDAKATMTTRFGHCQSGSFVEGTVPAYIFCKPLCDNCHPYEGSELGNDCYRPFGSNAGCIDYSNFLEDPMVIDPAYGVLRWRDRPHMRMALSTAAVTHIGYSAGLHFQTSAEFYARFFPWGTEGFSIPPGYPMCMEWKLFWDLSFDATGNQCDYAQGPTITDFSQWTGEGCAPLAP